MKSKINLLKYRGNDSTMFTGRPQGESARRELALSEKDKRREEVILVIPQGTTSFNPSFYLGLLFESIKHYGVDNFEEYYKFDIEDDNEVIRKILLEDISDGKRNAINTLSGKSGLGRFL